MKKIYILIIWLGLWHQVQAQNVINPINKLIKATYENKMFSHRLLMDYVLLKNNIYQNKILPDIDNILARYDENLIYLSQFSEKDKDTKKKFINLQLFWNDYRLLFIDYEKANFNKLVEATKDFVKNNNELNSSLIDTNKLKSKYKDKLETLDIIATINNQIYQLLINYFNQEENTYKVDVKTILKNIKKLQKTEIGKNNLNIIEDLKNTLSVIESLYTSKNNSKQMYSNVSYFTKKNFILMNKVLSNINE